MGIDSSSHSGPGRDTRRVGRERTARRIGRWRRIIDLRVGAEDHDGHPSRGLRQAGNCRGQQVARRLWPGELRCWQECQGIGDLRGWDRYASEGTRKEAGGGRKRGGGDGKEERWVRY
jgi:hypothetical protein